MSSFVHDGFRGEVGLTERNPLGESNERNGIHRHTRPCQQSQGRSPSASWASTCERTAGSHAGHRAGPQGDADGRAVELPGLRPASDRGAPGAGRVDGGRRRQPLRRLRHGLRRAVRRPLQSARAQRDRAASSTTARCSSRRASSTPTSPSCSRRATGCRCGASPTAAPRRRWMPSASLAASPVATRSSRSRVATTAITTR